MKKIILITSFFLLFIFSFSLVRAQVKQDSIAKNESFVSLGMTLGSTYETPKGEQGDFKIGFASFIKINLNKNFSFNSGLSFDNLQDHKNFILDYYSSLLHRKTEHQYSFLSIPASLCFQLNKPKFKPLLEVGFQGSILMKNQFYSDDEIFHEKEMLFSNGSTCAFYYVGAGFIYTFKNAWGVLLTTNYYSSFVPLKWYQIDTIGEKIEEHQYLNYYKINIGVLYSFTK